MNPTEFSILISTKNRSKDLFFSLSQIYDLISPNVTCVVFDDGSSDDTYEMVKSHFPKVVLHRNESSKGYIYCRNIMLNTTKADYAISLDDDAHFLVDNPLECIKSYFINSPKCGVIAFRIFWSKSKLKNFESIEIPHVVNSFVGCGHAWRMKSWRDIPNYPEWYHFYGEENFASFQLFKKKWEIHYVPEILIQHRVDMKLRSIQKKDFNFRYRYALRSDWFNILLFTPVNKIPKLIGYSIWMQFRNKIFKGNLKVIYPLIRAIFDMMIYLSKTIGNKYRLTEVEYADFLKLKEVNVYWKPEN